MKNTRVILLINIVFFVLFSVQTIIFAQSEPVMYFCERYDEFEGEVGISNSFPRGPINILVRCDYSLNLDKVTIQYDKYDLTTGNFFYYEKAYFDVDNDKSYLSFFMDEEINMEFEDPGFYRVFLLDEDGKTVTSSLVEIID